MNTNISAPHFTLDQSQNHSAAACSSSHAIKVESSHQKPPSLILPMCLKKQVLPICPPLFAPPRRDAASPLCPNDFKTPWRSHNGARKLPDVNKHSGVLPSKGPNHCCGQSCLAHVMLDDVAGSVLAVLMYSGASHDLLKSCGEGGMCSTTMLSLLRSKSSVKTDDCLENGDKTLHIHTHTQPFLHIYRLLLTGILYLD